MKKYFVLIIFFCGIFGCSESDTERNPFLGEIGFSFNINLNLPLYSSLNTPGNSIYIGNVGVGIRGIFVTNTGSSFVAFEASCPNHIPNGCSTMTATSSTTCECSCEGYSYNLFSGQPLNILEGENLYSMLNYRATLVDNSIIISN